jgi:uncharacterized protein YeaO (DUF488 family)
MVRIKRVYDPPAPEDGLRLLVDRLWPRGVTKDAAALSGWWQELAPSPELRRWFDHDPARWPEFQERYRTELAAPRPQTLLAELAETARRETVTLVFAAKDAARNNAVVLKELLEARLAAVEQA